jgi:DNA gyrase subunit A
MSVSEMRVMGRNTQGVKLINLKNNDEIAAITKIEKEEGVEEEEETEGISPEISSDGDIGDVSQEENTESQE